MREEQSVIDTTIAQSPRVWNYWLGGKDNYEVDRVVGEQIMASTPKIVELARVSRVFLKRTVEYLAGPAGVRQFLDIGTGLPTADNTHQVAQRIAPESHIVYVDNDPVVLAHARVLLQGTTTGSTAYVDADMHDTDTILAAAAESLDFSKPIALMYMNVLGHVNDPDEACAIAGRMLAALPSGSYLVSSDSTDVVDPEAMKVAAELWNSSAAVPITLRTPEEIGRLFDGLELLDPGVVSCAQWRPPVGAPVPVDQFGGVGRKP